MQPSDDFDDLLQAGMTVLAEPFARRSRRERLVSWVRALFLTPPEPLDAVLFRRLGYRAQIASAKAFGQDSLQRMVLQRKRLAIWLMWLRLRVFVARNAGVLYFLLFITVAAGLLLAAWVWQDSLMALLSDILAPANPPSATSAPPLTGQTGGTP